MRVAVDVGACLLGLFVACGPGTEPVSVAPTEQTPREPSPVIIHSTHEGFIHVDHPDRSEALVIRDRAAFEAFVDRIPVHAHHVLIVLIRADTPWGKIDVADVSREGTALRVRSSHRPLGYDGPLAQPIGVGSYHAIVVDRFDGPLLMDDDDVR